MLLKRSNSSNLLLLLAAVPRLLLAQATVTLSSSPNPSIFGAPVSLTATVSPATATGRVTFFDGVAILGTKPVSAGTASISTILLPAGSRKLTAFFRDSRSANTATSNVLVQTVNAVAGSSFVPQNVGTPAAPPVVVGDFNGDGNADLVFPTAVTDPNPWWQVDLGTPALIGSVTIWNRTDCCGALLSDYWIFISNTPFLATDTPATLQSRIGTFSSHQTVAPNPSSTISANAQGRYIRVQLTSGTSLSLAEVQVFGVAGLATTNFALGKTATQSTTLPGFNTGAFSAVDGNTDGNLSHGSVSATGTNFVSVVFGNGDGTFRAPVNYAVSTGATSLTTGDFNGDGITDLAVATFVPGSAPFGTAAVNILLGNSDGTFRAAVTYPTGTNSQITGIAAGDFNGDGAADLVVGFATHIAGSPSAGSGANLLPGIGDGTFGPPLNFATLGGPPLAVADFNGDGKADLALATAPVHGTFVANPQILLGNGDGTALTAISIDLGMTAFASSLLTGDFNRDGKTDLAIGGIGFINGAPVNSTWILLGNGDGSFQTPVRYSLGSVVALGDFNGDGITDLVVGDTSGNMGLLLGRGNGTFQEQALIPISGPQVVADFNGDGRADILAANSILLAAGAASGGSFGLNASGGTPQFAAVGRPFAIALQVTLTDSSGQPVSGATVTFTSPASGAGATLSSGTAITNASGVASVNATANGTAGSYTVTASVGSLSASFVLTNIVAGSTNLALGKTATQSSTLSAYPSSIAASAVDGNTDGNFFHGSVTATNLDTNAWWQVDLGASTAIGSVVISNRTDCCGTRLNDFWLFISDTPLLATDTPNTLQGRTGIFSSHQITAPDTITVTANVRGRYVRVQLTGANYLSLAEVQVMAGGVAASGNLALGGTATQSSTYPGSPAAGAAVDGNTDGNFYNGSVTATLADPAPWWQVDLGASAVIGSIVIFNRTDCCASRLNDYWVFVSDTPFLPGDTPANLQTRAGTFGIHQTTAPNPSTTLSVAAQGRYVRVQLTASNYLSLAEVQVIAAGTTATPPNLARGKAATQSSIYPGFPSAAAGSAVDGNTDGNFGNGSVTATNNDPGSWWQVDLGASAAIGSIVIWNRTDCCSTRLNDYWVFVSNTPFLDTDTPATLSTRTGTFNSHQTTAPSPSATIAAVTQGRYVRVQLSSPNYLSLAEVQVFGQ